LRQHKETWAAVCVGIVLSFFLVRQLGMMAIAYVPVSIGLAVIVSVGLRNCRMLARDGTNLLALMMFLIFGAVIMVLQLIRGPE
jgi:hypothetical protein